MHRSVRIAFVILLMMVTGDSALSQTAVLKPFTVDTSPLTIELRALKTSKPNMTPDEFVSAANELLEKDGLGFTFYFDPTTCDKIEKAFVGKKPGDASPVIKASLNSVGGEKASIILPPPDPASCAPCSVTLPMLQVTQADFITKISDRNIKFFMPPEFATDQIQLLDVNDTTKVKQTWRVPLKSTPLGILYDENAIYLTVPTADLTELSLLVFDDGTFQFATRKEAESVGKVISFDSSKTNDPTHSYLQFQNRDKKQLVRFPKACK